MPVCVDDAAVHPRATPVALSHIPQTRKSPRRRGAGGAAEQLGPNAPAARHPRAAPLALSRLPDLTLDKTPIGVFRDVERPTYDAQMAAQLRQGAVKPGDLQRLLRGTDTWTVA